MKICLKIINLVAIITILLNFMSIFYYDSYAATYDKMMKDAKQFLNTGKSESQDMSGKMNKLTEELVPLGQLLTTIGAGVLVAVTTYMGIKYVTSGPEAQAKLKQQLIGVIVSAIVIFGAYGIWKTVGTIAQTFEK